jgi:UDP-N-acetylglucosamine--N-acetylmuramyl-(pentapeptide) pyrophosphoryl-undecaprenol N-acetylglucosamine transferase
LTGEKTYRFIFAGGGTGGHLYPAIAVAQQLMELKPDAEILFVGTKTKIEASVVPALGFKFRTIWISGFSRQLTLRNLLFPVKLITALLQSLKIMISFKPTVVIGTGSYIAGPVVWAASVLGAKIILLEQNSYPGITNRLLEKKAEEIHLSFEESKKYFRQEAKLKLTGNPIRINLVKKDKDVSKKQFGFDKEKKTLFITGGSLGAKSINESIAKNIERVKDYNLQVIWQTGKLYFDKYKHLESDSIKVLSFVDDMSAAYSAADLVVARAGATTIAEVSFLGVPVLFIPSPNVAANHQYKNAMALKDIEAGEVINDTEIESNLLNKIESMINDEDLLKKFSMNIKSISKPDAAKVIAERAIMLAERRL